MSIPQNYLTTIQSQQYSRFNVNAIKSFVYHVFALYDRHPDVSQFLPLLADQGLEMQGLDEKNTIRSHQDFRKWYKQIGTDYKSHLYRVKRIDVTLFGNEKYEVDVDVVWQAVLKENDFIHSQGHQIWKMDDGNQVEWPRILSYIVERT